MLGILNTIPVFGQGSDAGQEFEISQIEVDVVKSELELYLKALDREQPMELNLAGLEVIESIEGQSTRLSILPPIKDSLIITTDSNRIESADILFLIDVSAKSGRSGVREAQEISKKILADMPYSNANYYLATFSDDLSPIKKYTPQKLKDQLGRLAADDRNPDFYYSLMEGIRFLKNKQSDKKIFFIIGSGQNFIANNDRYDYQLPYSTVDILAQVKDLGLSNYFMPIAIGDQAKTKFLEELVTISRCKEDQFSYAQAPDQKVLGNILEGGQSIASNYIVKLKPGDPAFKGRNRTYTLQWRKLKTPTFAMNPIGSLDAPLGLRFSSTDFLVYFLIGLFIILGFLLVVSLLVPYIRSRNFRLDFVKPYVQQGNRRKMDPITNEPINPGDLVVMKCQQITPLTTWESLGHCPNFPDCLNFHVPCSGAGAPTGQERFFSMQGIYRKLNWTWFGAVGGFLAWIIFALFQVFDFSWYKKMISQLFNESYIRKTSSLLDSSQWNLQLETLTNNTLVGVAFGIGLIFMLSWVEERSQPRKVSVGRIVLRTLLAGFIAFGVFALGFYLRYYDFLGSNYMAGLITWLLLGFAIGLILSVKSSIMFSRGVLGGLISCILAYHIYLGIEMLTGDFILGKLFSLIILGAVLGTILVTVVTALEDFELEYLSPEKFRNIVPISKWLKSGVDINIGNDSGCYVYIKWDDGAVQPQHAKLTYENGTVAITPFAETLIRGRQITHNRKTNLKHNDIIQLGRESITRIRYKEKRKAVNNPLPPDNPGPDTNDKPRIKIGK